MQLADRAGVDASEPATAQRAAGTLRLLAPSTGSVVDAVLANVHRTKGSSHKFLVINCIVNVQVGDGGAA